MLLKQMWKLAIWRLSLGTVSSSVTTFGANTSYSQCAGIKAWRERKLHTAQHMHMLLTSWNGNIWLFHNCTLKTSRLLLVDYIAEMNVKLNLILTSTLYSLIQYSLFKWNTPLLYTFFWIQTLDPVHVRQGLNSFPNSPLASLIQPADTENN